MNLHYLIRLIQCQRDSKPQRVPDTASLSRSSLATVILEPFVCIDSDLKLDTLVLLHMCVAAAVFSLLH